MQMRDVFSKKTKNQILTVALQIYAKVSFRRLYGNLSYLFQHLSNKPYPNVKIILAYLYITKII